MERQEEDGEDFSLVATQSNEGTSVTLTSTPRIACGMPTIERDGSAFPDARTKDVPDRERTRFTHSSWAIQDPAPTLMRAASEATPRANGLYRGGQGAFPAPWEDDFRPRR